MKNLFGQPNVEPSFAESITALGMVIAILLIWLVVFYKFWQYLGWYIKGKLGFYKENQGDEADDN